MSKTLLIWWFAIVLHDGQALFFEYRSMEACKIVQASYKKSLTMAKITECRAKGSQKGPEKQGILVPRDAT